MRSGKSEAEIYRMVEELRHAVEPQLASNVDKKMRLKRQGGAKWKHR